MPWCLISLLQRKNLPPPPVPALAAPRGPRWQDCFRTLFLACLILCTQLWRLTASGPGLTKHHPLISHPNAALRQCRSCPWQQSQSLKANSTFSFTNTWESLCKMQIVSVCWLLSILYFSFKHHFFPQVMQSSCAVEVQGQTVSLGIRTHPMKEFAFRSR